MSYSFHPILRTTAAAVLCIALGGAVGFAQPRAEVSAAPKTDATAAPNVAEPGILVFGVQSGSPVEKAGVVRGDIILAADGTAVNTPMDLGKIIAAKKQGDSVSLKLQHGDATKTVTVTLGSQGGRPWIGLVPGMYGAGMYREGMGMRRMGERGRGMRGFGTGGMFPFEGAFVASVVTGGPAEKAGLKPGDVILGVDGAVVDARNNLGDLIAAKKVGDTVTLSVLTRGQLPRDVKVTLEKNPSKDGPYLGVQYSAGPQGFGPDGVGPGMMQGAFVADVAANSPAAKAGIAVRDLITKVDGAVVNDPQQVVDAVNGHKPGDTLAVTVRGMPDGKDRDLTVTLGANPNDATRAWLGVSMSVLRGMRGSQGPAGRQALPHQGQGANGTAPSASTPTGNPPNI
jgi:S1-C subfamily serine protease